ncbi:MAG: trypsin-like peptidase domain-containing protein [Pseudomonadales bacterium]|jgi:Do/DeqQ family serine protease|nr:trypsin-like peptidase domain-containing protein [Pseudomonadales bacterium]MBL6808372.1 trypsin-like peptidase domain-containing protein [Pseudomonadales bacterium]
MKCWVVLALGALLAAPGGAALPGALADGTPLPSLAPVLESVTPGVVNIATETDVSVANPLLQDPFFRRFFEVPRRQQRKARSAGSGVIIDGEGGLVLTNHHVVGQADRITVTLASGAQLSATRLGSDPQVDLALLALDPAALANLPPLQALRFGDSRALRVGDFVVAIGNPFGIGQTVTSGIVSALGRSGLGLEGYEDFIQTDASINPGNSGGALVDLAGQLVGINTAIFAPNGGNVGIGFAIPSAMAKRIAEALREDGQVRRADLGLAVQPLDASLAEAFSVAQGAGALVRAVRPGGAAARAGLAVGDILLELGERSIRQEGDLRAQAAVTLLGDEIPFKALREGLPVQGVLVFGEADRLRLAGAELARGLAGAELQSTGQGEQPEGVTLLTVVPGSPAWRLGLRAGDRIVALDGVRVMALAGLVERLGRSGGRLGLRIHREGRDYALSIPR